MIVSCSAVMLRSVRGGRRFKRSTSSIPSKCGLGSYHTNSDTPLKTNEDKSYQSIASFYAGKSVFLTGGTGFLGKVFIEKLLYSCEDLDKIYVLIRAKNASVDVRLQQLLENPLFSRIKNNKPEVIKKLVPVEGDLAEENLGLTPEDKDTLINKVSVVIHSGATVKFIDTLKKIMDINYEGTRRVLDLSKKMKNIDALVYVSTAFSNAHRSVINETVYPPPKKIEDVRRFAEKNITNQREIEKFIEVKTIKYTLSKALAESLIAENSDRVPTIIVRPSIIGPILNDPIPGWLDSWVAATALCSDVARGLTHSVYGHKSVVCDIIPVDFVSNLTLIAAARYKKSKDVAVYNCCSSSTNPITWSRAVEMFVEESYQYNYKELPYPKAFFTESKIALAVMTNMLQLVPAHVADLWLKITGKQPRYVDLQQRAILLRDVIRPFTSTHWLMTSSRAQALANTLDEHDSKEFQCDTYSINWEKYMPIFCSGVKKFMLGKK